MEAVKLLFFLIAVVLFLLDAFLVRPVKVNLLALGLAAFTVPFLLDAFQEL